MNTALIEKIRKLRALSQSSNVHEAAAAAAAAERLIQEHQIAEAELDTDEPDAAPVTETLDELGGQIPTWKAWLSQILEKAHGCAGYHSYRNGKKILVLVGRPDDIATVKYLYAWLTLEIERLCKAAKLSGRTSNNSFRVGAVHGIKEAMYTTRQAVRATASSEALVRIDARLDAAKAAMPSGLRSGSTPSFGIDGSAYKAGKRAGSNIHAGQSLGQGGTRLLGR